MFSAGLPQRHCKIQLHELADLLTEIQQDDFLLSVIVVLGIGHVELDSYCEEAYMGHV